MTRSALAVVALLLVALAAVACGASADLGRVMIVGDSISHGSSGDYTWRYWLYQHLEQRRVTVDFVGPRDDLFAIATGADGDGDHTYADPNFDTDHDATWGRMLSDETAEIAGKVALYEPDYLLVLLGINDLTWRSVSADEFETTLRTFIANARSAKPDVNFVIGRLLPSTTSPSGSERGARVADANTRISTVAASLGTAQSPITIAATDEAFVPEEHTWDGTHPNTAGELRIAAAFADALGLPYPRPIPDPPAAAVPAPALVGTVRGPGSVALSWTEPAGTYAYWIWDRAGAAARWQRLPAYIAADQTPWSLTGLTTGVAHQFRVQPVKTPQFSNTITLDPTRPG